jgi:hypothetical protein
VVDIGGGSQIGIEQITEEMFVVIFSNTLPNIDAVMIANSYLFPAFSTHTAVLFIFLSAR